MDRGVFLYNLALDVLLWFLLLVKLPHLQHISTGGESSYQGVSFWQCRTDRYLHTRTELLKRKCQKTKTA